MNWSRLFTPTMLLLLLSLLLAEAYVPNRYAERYESAGDSRPIKQDYDMGDLILKKLRFRQPSGTESEIFDEYDRNSLARLIHKRQVTSTNTTDETLVAQMVRILTRLRERVESNPVLTMPSIRFG